MKLPQAVTTRGERAKNIFFIWQNNFIIILFHLIIIVITASPNFQVVLQKPSLRPVSREARKEEEEVKEHHDDYDEFDHSIIFYHS